MTDTGPSASGDLPLFLWLSPAFPVGGFAYSHGLEAVVEAGLVTDAATLAAWIEDLVRYGSIQQDATVLAAAHAAALARDTDALAAVNELALALCPGRERRLETGAMGTAFVTTLRATWPATLPDNVLAGEVAYPVAVGAASAGARLPLPHTIATFTLAFVANLVSAAVRLGPIGQTDGQRVSAAAVPAAQRLGEAAARSSLDDIGACALRSDLAALQHETQYSRLFRS